MDKKAKEPGVGEAEELEPEESAPNMSDVKIAANTLVLEKSPPWMTTKQLDEIAASLTAQIMQIWDKRP